MKIKNKTMFHTHFFKENTQNPRILYCSCGEIKEIPCNHKWEFYKQNAVITMYEKKHILEHLKCTECGELKGYNLTTGEQIAED